MSIEKPLQDALIKRLQKLGIDFVRVRNAAGVRAKTASSHTTTFKDRLPTELDGKIKDSFGCDKYFPDIMFCVGGKCWMVEFGGEGKHKDRKHMQAIRMDHWGDHGGVITNFCYNQSDLDRILFEVHKSFNEWV